MEADTDQPREAVESQHGCKAVFVQAVPVHDEFGGETAWEGVVHIFALEAHWATRAYLESGCRDKRGVE
jgi:hypothetical protein